MPDQTLDELRLALEHANAEARRWKTIARVLAERVRELNSDAVLECGQPGPTTAWWSCARPKGHEGPHAWARHE